MLRAVRTASSLGTLEFVPGDPTDVTNACAATVPICPLLISVPPGIVVLWLSPAGVIVQAVVGAVNVVLLTLSRVAAPAAVTDHPDPPAVPVNVQPVSRQSPVVVGGNVLG